MVFIKPFSMLSMGQRYRAMLADLLLSGADIWVIDEFCSILIQLPRQSFLPKFADWQSNMESFLWRQQQTFLTS